jgi:dienelactone hydrolase
LDILLKMNDNGKKVLEFLSTIGFNENVEIATCGHSLGGALSPLVALKLVEMKERNGFSNGTVSCYPSAGPTRSLGYEKKSLMYDSADLQSVPTKYVKKSLRAHKSRSLGYEKKSLMYDSADLQSMPTKYVKKSLRAHKTNLQEKK